MRIVNESFETIDESEIDMGKGYLAEGQVIREDAEPIDNITKFAWDDDDYEDVMIYMLSKESLLDSYKNNDTSVWEELDKAYQEGVDSV